MSPRKKDDLNWKLLEPIEQMQGEDKQDTALLRKMYEEAKRWVAKQSWASPVKEAYYGMGVGGVVALFVFQLEKKAGTAGSQLWVVTGDLPNVAFPTEDLPDAAQALEWYCELMDDWATAVKEGKDLAEVYPVETMPTPANARALASRVKTLRKQIIPEFRKALAAAD